MEGGWESEVVVVGSCAEKESGREPEIDALWNTRTTLVSRECSLRRGSSVRVFQCMVWGVGFEIEKFVALLTCIAFKTSRMFIPTLINPFRFANIGV